MSSRLAQS